ncbi:MAG: ABC transporter permease [Cycloclasticus sp. symbiont of Poecilosclerida sp. M]|nr:MAG: ABC transporter permease [Cycloclasticus sp. symbiont of Poecilosclerida sp. M]
MPRSSFLTSTLSLGALLLIWQLCALLASTPLLPEPAEVLVALFNEITRGELPHHLAITLYRLTVSFFIAMTIGSAVGIALGRSQKANAFFDNWLIIFLNIPALVTIILCYVWFGLIETAAILAVVVNKIPNVIVTLREGARNLDEDLVQMAKAYQFSRLKMLRHVILPQLYPYIMASARTGLALIWKIILVVELLGRSDGMGYQIHLFFQLFDVTSILVYTVAFIIVIQLIETAILKPLDTHSQRWK